MADVQTWRVQECMILFVQFLVLHVLFIWQNYRTGSVL